MVLLDLLAVRKGYELVVAHFDHGIRADSKTDRLMVESLAKKLKLPFIYKEGKLGSKATEETARDRRYDFLKHVRRQHKADGIITAHHLDDALETAVFKAAKGMPEAALTPMHNNTQIIRPLLGISKQELVSYAESRGLPWREDSTNLDLAITRNFIRHRVMPLLPHEFARQFQKLAKQSKSKKSQL